MRRIVAIVAGLLLVGVSLLAAGRELSLGVANWERLGPLPPGGPTPDFSVPTLAGGSFSAADLSGKVTVLTFWATWCGACASEMVDLDELQHEYADDDVQFIAVNNEGRGVGPRQSGPLVRHYLDKRELTLPTALDDGRAARSFRVGPIPHTLVIGRDGIVRHIHQGRVMSSTLRQEIDALR